MNVFDRVKVEYKKNNDFLSLPCYPLNRYSLSRKIPIEKERKKGRKKEREKERKKERNKERKKEKIRIEHKPN